MNLAELKEIIDRTIKNTIVPAEDINVEVDMTTLPTDDYEALYDCDVLAATYIDACYPRFVIIPGDSIDPATKAEREIGNKIKDRQYMDEPDGFDDDPKEDLLGRLGTARNQAGTGKNDVTY
ncbi:hypothetical protein ER57_08180, partial [Smithella sp. SCADC]|jgi:hypothetical protein